MSIFDWYWSSLLWSVLCREFGEGFGLREKREFWGTGIGRSFVGIKRRSVDLRLVDHISGVSNLLAPTCRPPWKPKVLNRLRPWPCSLLLFSDICYLSTYHCFCFATVFLQPTSILLLLTLTHILRQPNKNRNYKRTTLFLLAVAFCWCGFLLQLLCCLHCDDCISKSAVLSWVCFCCPRWFVHVVQLHFGLHFCCLECSSGSGDPAMIADGKYLPKRVTQSLIQQQILQDT